MQRVKKLVEEKLKGERITLEKAPEVEVKGLMVALRETLKELEQQK